MAREADPRFEQVRRLGGNAYAAWLAAGYREYYQRTDIGRTTPYLLQKRILDEAGVTLFFVNAWAYDWSAYADWGAPKVSIAAESQFNTHVDQSPTFNVELLHPEDPASAEAFFLKLYRAMDCQPYGD